MIPIFQFSRFLAEKTSCAISIHSEASEESTAGTAVTGVTTALLCSTFFAALPYIHYNNKNTPQ